MAVRLRGGVRRREAAEAHPEEVGQRVAGTAVALGLRRLRLAVEVRGRAAQVARTLPGLVRRGEKGHPQDGPEGSALAGHGGGSPWRKPFVRRASRIPVGAGCNCGRVVSVEQRFGWSPPISRILSWVAIYLRGQPGGSVSNVNPSLFGLASDGVCPASPSPGLPVGSYPTISPLPRQAEAVCFCGTFRRVAPPWLAPGVLLVDVRTFLPFGRASGAATWRTPRRSIPWRTVANDGEAPGDRRPLFAIGRRLSYSLATFSIVVGAAGASEAAMRRQRSARIAAGRSAGLTRAISAYTSAASVNAP